MKRTRCVPMVAVLLVALAGRVEAQGGAKQHGPPGGAPVAGAQGAAVQQQARQAAHVQARSMQRGSPEWHSARQLEARHMVREEHHYRMRVARIERVQEIYRKQGRLDRVAELDRLRTRARDQLREHQEDCRLTLGEEDYDRLQDRMRDRDRVRDPDMDQDRDQDRDRVQRSDGR